MAAGDPVDGKRTVTQKLSELVEWYLGDRDVELKFVPNTVRRGRYAPEFDFQYWIEGRQISERGIAMLINAELARLNYNYVLSKIIGALVELSWRHYMATCDYPEWLNTPTPELKRPPGRPRKRPVKVTVPDVAKPSDNQIRLQTA